MNPVSPEYEAFSQPVPSLRLPNLEPSQERQPSFLHFTLNESPPEQAERKKRLQNHSRRKSL